MFFVCVVVVYADNEIILLDETLEDVNRKNLAGKPYIIMCLKEETAEDGILYRNLTGT